jgi:hypothetical protein
VREKKTRAPRKTPAKAAAVPAREARTPVADGETPAKKSEHARRQEALELIAETVEALTAERGEEEKIWGSMVKQALKRRKPGFNESYYGFRSFNGMLEEAERDGALTLERDEKSGGYIVRLSGAEE